jgi:glycosyltransferase involved in cell wall biosynthesis
MGKWSHQMAAGLRSRGHQVDMWFLDDFPLLRRAGRLARVLFPAALAARLAAYRRRIDVALVHEPHGAIYGLMRCLWPHLPPMVLMCHNVQSHVFQTMAAAARAGLADVSLKEQVMYHGVNRCLSDGAIRLADKVICLSSRDWTYLTTRLRRRPGDVLRKVNGVDERFFIRDRTYGRPPRVLFVGGWIDVKGRRLLPRIWERVAARVPAATLSVIGTGQPAEVVLAEFPEACRGSVTVVPRLSAEDEMARCYRDHDIFLLPSLTEGSPLSLVEALAGGLAAVAADVGGVPDILTSPIDGLLFPRGDADAAAARLVTLLSDPALVIRLAAAGRRRADELTWAAAASAVEALVRAALGMPAAPDNFAGAPGRWPPVHAGEGALHGPRVAHEDL